MQQVYKIFTLEDPSLQNIEIFFTLLRICHWKCKEDTLCSLGTWEIKVHMFKFWTMDEHKYISSTQKYIVSSINYFEESYVSSLAFVCYRLWRLCFANIL